MYSSSFLESKRYNKLHVENDQEVRSFTLAPLIVEGGSVFKKTSYFLGSLIVGQTKDEKVGMISFRQGEFMGFDGNQWVSFTKDNVWIGGDGVLYTEGKRIGINKINPKKMLEVGGDALIEKKLFVMDDLKLDGCLLLGENIGKKKAGSIRFWENNFEGFDGEKWIRFGGGITEQIEHVNLAPVIDLCSVEKIKLQNCPLTFVSHDNETHFYYNNLRREFRLEKLHSESYDSIQMEDLSIGNLKMHGDILFPEGAKIRYTIKNVSDPVHANEVATKKYVDQICQGLQNYFVSDYLFMEHDGVIEDKEDSTEILLHRDIGEIKEEKYIFILMKQRVELLSVVRVETIEEKIVLKLKNISNVQTPAKLCVKEGRYGQSEYFIFDKENEISYLQINGIESLEYRGPIVRIGKEIKLKYDPSIFQNNDTLCLKDNFICEKYLANECISDRNIRENNILNKHIADGQIDSRHLGSKVINHSHIMPKSIGDSHMKDGFLKNHHFTPGIITEKELGNECVGVTMLKPSVILSKHLTKSCVMKDNITEGQVEGRHLAEKIVDSKNLREKIILSEHISNGSIKSIHLSDKIVESRHIHSNLIGSEHIKEKSIGREHLMMNIIGGLHIDEEAIGSSHIKDQSITERHIVRKCIMDWHIHENSVKTVHLEDNSVNTGKIAEKSIIEKHFGEGVVGSGAIKKGVVQMHHLGMNCIEDKHIVNFSIKNNKLMEGVITESKLSEGCVTTGKIKEKSVTNDKMKLPFIKISSDPVFTCTQIVNLGETLNLGLNPNYMIPKRRDGVVEFMGSVRFGEEGSGQKMQVNMDMEVTGESEIKGKLKAKSLEINGENFQIVGEVKGFWNKVNLEDNFLNSWIKCDGKRVKRSDFYELYKALNIEEDEDEFHLPDIHSDNIDYYIRFKP